MLSGVYGFAGDPATYFIEGARPQWSCRFCGDADRVFFVLRRKGPKAKEVPFCIPCVLKYPGKFPVLLRKKLEDFRVMETLKDSSRKGEEGL